MNKEILLIIAALINFILYVIHFIIYKNKRGGFRKAWAYMTIGAGVGSTFINIAELIYGLSKDYSTLVLMVVTVISGIIMLIINRKSITIK